MSQKNSGRASGQEPDPFRRVLMLELGAAAVVILAGSAMLGAAAIFCGTPFWIGCTVTMVSVGLMVTIAVRINQCS
jgi:hypothetical protein